MPARLLFASVASLSLGCAHTPPFIWADEMPPPDPKTGYVIGYGDSLSVRVWNQEGMTTVVKVREDGKITVPLLNDVTAVGMTPNALADQMQNQLKQFFVKPVVTVSLETPRPLTVSIVGEVARPGVFTLEPGAGLLTALATAGGLSDYAHQDRIFVLRNDNPHPQRIRFRYESLVRETGPSFMFRLRPGDVIVVE